MLKFKQTEREGNITPHTGLSQGSQLNRKKKEKDQGAHHDVNFKNSITY